MNVKNSIVDRFKVENLLFFMRLTQFEGNLK